MQLPRAALITFNLVAAMWLIVVQASVLFLATWPLSSPAAVFAEAMMPWNLPAPSRHVARAAVLVLVFCLTLALAPLGGVIQVIRDFHLYYRRNLHLLDASQLSRNEDLAKEARTTLAAADKNGSGPSVHLLIMLGIIWISASLVFSGAGLISTVCLLLLNLALTVAALQIGGSVGLFTAYLDPNSRIEKLLDAIEAIEPKWTRRTDMYGALSALAYYSGAKLVLALGLTASGVVVLLT